MAEDWYNRLRAAIQKELDRGRSEREISLSAGLSPNYVGELMSRRVNAGTDNVLKLCRALRLSSTYIFTGVEMGPEEEEAAALLASLSENQRRAFLLILREK